MNRLRNHRDTDFSLDIGSLVGGAFLGSLIAAALTLLFSPINGETLRRTLQRRSENAIQRVTPVQIDPAAERIAEGKAAARRMRAELGLDRE